MGGNGYRHSTSKFEVTGFQRTAKGWQRAAIPATNPDVKHELNYDRKDFLHGVDRAGGINPEQRDAFRNYINDGYTAINEHLRSGGDLNANPDAKAMQEAILNFHTASSYTLYRGVTDENLTWDQAQKLTGKTLTDPGFSSASTDFLTGLQFNGPMASDAKGFNVVRQITVPKGSRAAPLGGPEGEMVLAANSRYAITGVQRMNYRDPITHENTPTIVVKMTYLGPKGLRGRPRKG